MSNFQFLAAFSTTKLVSLEFLPLHPFKLKKKVLCLHLYFKTSKQLKFQAYILINPIEIVIVKVLKLMSDEHPFAPFLFQHKKEPLSPEVFSFLCQLGNRRLSDISLRTFAAHFTLLKFHFLKGIISQHYQLLLKTNCHSQFQISSPLCHENSLEQFFTLHPFKFRIFLIISVHAFAS